MAKKKPVHQIPKHGAVYGVKVAIWDNSSEGDRPLYNATLERSYKDDAGEWQPSSSYGRNACLVASKLLGMAAEWMFAQEARDSSEEASE